MNKILLKDSLKFLQSCPDESVDLVFTDPPHNIAGGGGNVVHWTHNEKGEIVYRKVTRDFGKWDKFPSHSKFLEFSQTWVRECFRILKPEGNFVSFFPFDSISHLYRFWKKIGGMSIDFLCWHKTNPQPRFRKVDFMRSFELAFWGAKGEKHFFNYELGQRHNLFESAIHYGKRFHQTQKPLLILEPIVEYLCPKGGLVVDPFCGSGSIPLASLRTGRKFVAVDNDRRCVLVSRKRTRDPEWDGNLRFARGESVIYRFPRIEELGL